MTEQLMLWLVSGELALLVGLAVAGLRALRRPVLTTSLAKAKVANHANPADDPLFHVALPEEILDYCDEESELHAQEDCRARARRKIAELGSEVEAFVSLQREDGVVR